MITKTSRIIYTCSDGDVFTSPAQALAHENREEVQTELRALLTDTKLIFRAMEIAFILEHAVRIYEILHRHIGQQIESVEAPWGRDMGGAPLGAPIDGKISKNWRHPRFDTPQFGANITQAEEDMRKPYAQLDALMRRLGFEVVEGPTGGEFKACPQCLHIEWMDVDGKVVCATCKRPRDSQEECRP